MEYNKSIPLTALILLFIVLMENACSEVVLQKSESYITLDDFAYEKIMLTYSASYTSDSSSDNASEKEELEYKNYIKISGIPYNISVLDNKGELKFITVYENENEDNITAIKFNFRASLNEGDYYTITIRFSKELELPADNLAYEIDYEWDTSPLHMNVILRLSDKYELFNSLTEPVSMFSDDNYLVTRWVGYSTPRFITRLSFGKKEEVPFTEENKTQENAPGENASEFVSQKTTNHLAKDEERNYLLPAAIFFIILVIVIISIVIFLSKGKKPDKKPDNLAAEKVEKTLAPAELAIVEELRIENNLTQVELCRKTGIPRSTMSRIIAKLESKGVVEKIGEGMSTRIKLVEWMRK